ncbi:MAG: ATPase domain-containing protein [Wenzhouxiangellaceae bacterium]
MSNSKTDWHLQKRATGIAGLDRLTHGGLPRGQATLVLGDTGTGKTVLGLQILANAVEQGGAGLFVTFEESPAQLKRNADSFAWGRALTESEAWSTIDARSSIGAEIAGGFDIDGLLAVITSRVKGQKDPWIVIDGIDQLLQHQPDPTAAIDQIRQINEYCERHGWTLLLSGKIGGSGLSPRHLEGMEFMLPTMLLLTARVIDRRLNRFMRVAKYRGSAHVTDEVPMVMNLRGIQLPYLATAGEQRAEADTERISTGIERLDKVLGGGPYRGSSLLISGRPGTAKSTLAASIAQATAERGERALLVSFDEMEAPYVRNLASVGLKLQPHIDEERIRFYSRSATECLISEHLLELQRLIEDFRPHCLVVDPISALLKAPGAEGPRPAIEWLIELTRKHGITTVMTALTDEGDPEGESTLGQVSTIADSWIALDYNVRAGERNRSISIVKSRGTAHSNQQRELLLTSDGVELADVYEFGTEVLMGTARAHKQSEERASRRRAAVERERQHKDLERRIEQARNEVARLTTELELQEQEAEESSRIERRDAENVARRRQPDAQDDAGGEGK